MDNMYNLFSSLILSALIQNHLNVSPKIEVVNKAESEEENGKNYSCLQGYIYISCFDISPLVLSHLV